jgi:Ni/Co efflux regulator RcnB
LKSRTIAIAASIAALSFAAVPLAQAATTTHPMTRDSQVDKSGDRQLDKSKDNSKDKSSVDRHRDIRDR